MHQTNIEDEEATDSALLQSVLTPEVGKCQQESITYFITCVGCAEVGVTTQYYGESGRSGYQRALEHLKAHGGKNKNSPLWKHSFDHHNGTKQRYSFKVLKSFRSALARQISEAVLIQVAGPDMLLNSRGEWNMGNIPRLILEDKEPEEEWSSVRSKRKNISRDQGHSSSGSGGDGVTNGTEESKTKKCKVTVPLHATTPALKRTAEMAVSEERVNETGTGSCTQNGEGNDLITTVKELEVYGSNGEGKGDGKRSIVEGGKGEERVCPESSKPKAKRKYMKRNMEYWNLKEKVSVSTGQVVNK